MNKVAVVIPVRNRRDLLEKCLASLSAQDFPLEQSEVFVCDDGSSVDLQALVESFWDRIPDLRLVRTEGPRGPAAARNLGIRSSTSPIIICLDSDIICDRSFLSKLVQAMEDHPGWVAAEGTIVPSGGKGELLEDAPVSRPGRAFLSSATAYRREALSKAGGFDEEFLLPACEDAELAARLLTLGEFGSSAEAVAFHPVRQVTARTHWLWRRHWRYETILAKRYGFLAFPGNDAGRVPRLRVARAAVINLPAGRLIEAFAHPRQRASSRVRAALYAVFDILCGLCALPQILLSSTPERRNYIEAAQQAETHG